MSWQSHHLWNILTPEESRKHNGRKVKIMEEKHLLNGVCKVIKSKIYKQTNKNKPIKEQETLSSKITNYLNRY